MFYSKTALYFKILQNCSVLLRATPIRLCTTKYYSSTTLHFKVLLQYYLYYKMLLQDFSVLQSTTPALLWNVIYNARSKKKDSLSNFTKFCTCHATWIQWFICFTYQRSETIRGAARVTLSSVICFTYGNTKYYACHENRNLSLCASKVTLELHQVLRLPRKWR